MWYEKPATDRKLATKHLNDVARHLAMISHIVIILSIVKARV